MITLLLSLIFILPTLMGWGILSKKIFKQFIFEGITGNLMRGIFSLSFLFLCISFWSALSLYFEVFAVAIGLFFFIKNKGYNDFLLFLKSSGYFFYTSCIIVIFTGTFAPFILDHFGYYKPTIQWLNDYGLVKGLSNLDLTLGQMSVWHIFQAGFSHFVDAALRINTILLIVYLIYIFEHKTWFHLLFIPAMLLFVQSPSPDLPAYIFSLIIVQEILSKKNTSSGLLAFSLFTFSIKTTVIWLPIFVFIVLWVRKKIQLKEFILSTVVLGLFLFKNIWVFGYPIFPLGIIDFNLPWKPHPEILRMSSEYAVLKTYDAQYSLEQIRNFTFSEKITKWLFLPGIKSFFNIGLILFLVLYGIFARIKKEKKHYLLWLCLVTKSIIIISFSAQYRFFLEVFPVTLVAAFYTFNLKKIISIFFYSGSLIVILFLSYPEILQTCIPSFRLGSTMRKFEFSQVYKPAIYRYQSYTSSKVGNVKINVSKKYPFNFDTPLPAISESFIFDYQRLNIFPQLIDSKNISKGFYWKKLNTNEKKELNEAIKTIQKQYN